MKKLRNKLNKVKAHARNNDFKILDLTSLYSAYGAINNKCTNSSCTDTGNTKCNNKGCDNTNNNVACINNDG